MGCAELDASSTDSDEPVGNVEWFEKLSGLIPLEHLPTENKDQRKKQRQADQGLRDKR